MTELPAPDYPGAAQDAVWKRLVFPADYRNPEPRRRYHLVVIGAGPAGLVMAIAAAGLGAQVALVESTAMGGDCLNTGCVPSKALLEFTGRGGADFDAAFEWLRAVRARIAEHDSVERFTAAGVDVFLGRARFLDARTVAVGEQRLAARRFAITTGARPSLPPIQGLAESDPLTTETLFDLERPPRRLAILGAGPIGCEMAQALARLGVEVRLIEVAGRVLPGECAEAGQAVRDALEAAGVSVHTGAAVSRVRREHGAMHIEGDDIGIAADALLVATGRRPNSDDLGLETAGIETDEAGRVIVDRYLRTTNRAVYAAGDVCSARQLTHNADAHARIVVQNALFAPTAVTTRLIVPQCTYTDPEVAQVGQRAAELERARRPFDRYRVAFGALDRGATEGDEVGFAEVLAKRGGDRILGATIVGHDAGEQIAPICIAMTHGLGLAALGKTVLPYPTRAEYLRRLADSYNRTRLSPTARGVMQRWFRWRA